VVPRDIHEKVQCPKPGVGTFVEPLPLVVISFGNYLSLRFRQGRYKSVVIDPDESEYFHTACDYVHLNPARARLVGGKNQPLFREYEWSSSWYLSQSIKQDPVWLKLSRIVEEQGRRETSQAARLNYLRGLEIRSAEEQKRAESKDGFEGYRSLRRGWCFCGNEYKEKLKEEKGSKKRGQSGMALP